MTKLSLRVNRLRLGRTGALKVSASLLGAPNNGEVVMIWGGVTGLGASVGSMGSVSVETGSIGACTSYSSSEDSEWSRLLMR